MKNNKILNIFYFFLLIQPLIDLITSIMTKFLNFSITLGLLARGLIFITSVIYILLFSKSKYKKISFIYLFSVLIYLTIYFLTKNELFNNSAWIFTEFIYVFKYFYFNILIVFFLNFFDEFQPNNRKIFKLLETSFFTYCFIIFLANITGTAFGTYEFGSGNTGWFYSGNEIGIIVSLLFPLLFIIINKVDSFKVLYLIIPCIITLEFIGTKTSMLGLILPTFLFFIYYLFKIKKGKWKQYIVVTLMIALIGLSYAKIPISENIKNGLNKFENRKNVTTNIKNFQQNNFRRPKYSSNVFSSIILSDRDYYLQQIKFIYDDADLTDKLFGVGFVNREKINDDRIEKLIEMDFFDVYYRYGVIGFVVYIIPIFVFLIVVIKEIISLRLKLNLKQLLLCYISFVGLFIATIVGHTVSAPAVSFYLALIMIMTIYYLKNSRYRISIIDNKITILALHLGTGGIEKYISSLVKMLHKNYIIEIIVTYKISENPAFNFPDDVKITYLINDYPKKALFKEYLSKKQFIKTFALLFNFVKLLFLKYYKNIRTVEEINSKYIITTRSFHNKIVSNNKNRDIVAIATEHNYHDNNKKYINALIRSCKNINYLVLVSNDLKAFYESRLKNTECIYIPNVIDYIPNYQSKNKINNKLVSVGRLSHEKGYSDLIDIISIIKNQIPNIQLDIYGDGLLYKQLENKIKTLKLENNINLKGFCNHDKILKELKKYDLYVMTSYTESFGLVLVEAMSMSLSCIAFDSANGAKNLLSNGKGVLVKNRDKEEYAKEVMKILNDINLLNKISKQGYDSLNVYSINNVKKKWIELLSKND